MLKKRAAREKKWAAFLKKEAAFLKKWAAFFQKRAAEKCPRAWDVFACGRGWIFGLGRIANPTEQFPPGATKTVLPVQAKLFSGATKTDNGATKTDNGATKTNSGATKNSLTRVSRARVRARHTIYILAPFHLYFFRLHRGLKKLC